MALALAHPIFIAVSISALSISVVLYGRGVDGHSILPPMLMKPAGASVQRVSLSFAGHQVRQDSTDVAVSANGRFVAFTSSARMLVRRDTNESTRCVCARPPDRNDDFGVGHPRR